MKLSVRVGEQVLIGGPAKLTVEQKSGQVVILAFEADRSIPIYRVGSSSSQGEPIGLGKAAATIQGKPRQP